MDTTMTNEVDAPIEYFSDHASYATRDLDSLAEPGQVTLIGGLVSKSDTPQVARAATLYFAKREAEAKKNVCVVTDQPTSQITGTLEVAKINVSGMWRKPITKHTTKESIIKGAKGTDLVLLWLPSQSTREAVEMHFEAARTIADEGAAVILVCAMKEQGLHNYTDAQRVIGFTLAGGIPAETVDRVWMAIDHDEAVGLHSLKTMHCLAPINDPTTTKGYTFTLESGLPSFRFDSRSGNARGMIRSNIVEVNLRG